MITSVSEEMSEPMSSCYCQMVQLYHGNLDMQDGVSLMPIILHPQSAGTVRLRSSNPGESPAIDPKFLTEKEDVDTAIEGILLHQSINYSLLMIRIQHNVVVIVI